MEWGGLSVDARATVAPPAPGELLVSQQELQLWGKACLVRAGSEPGPAAIMAAILLEADMRGHYSHGFNRLNIYCEDIRSGACTPNQSPLVVTETAAAALVDGQAGLGGVVGEFCMKLAIEKARNSGVGWVTARNSNHFGIAGHYSMMAQRSGMIGM